jgi:hypothetical protein
MKLSVDTENRMTSTWRTGELFCLGLKIENFSFRGSGEKDFTAPAFEWQKQLSYLVETWNQGRDPKLIARRDITPASQ